MPDVVMPRLSDSMEEGTILRWLKASGEEVARGEELVEIETDKANMTYESDAAGTLEIVAEEGATLPIGELIARVGGGSDGGGGAAGASAAADDTVMDRPRDATKSQDSDERGGRDEPRREAAAPAGDGRVKASPVARRLAKERGIDLATVSGTGPGGRIVKADVEAAEAAPAAPAREPATAETPATAEAPALAPTTPGPVSPGERGGGKGEVRTEELSRTQQTIARRMAEAKATIPDFQVTTEVDMAAAVAVREQLKALATEERPAPSFNDLVVKAAALALREHPRANGAYRDGRFELYERVNVGVAVAAEDSLIVPTIFDADQKSLGEIAVEARALAARVRDRQITPPELSGGTFTVSNLGMFGVTEFTAIISGGQAGILAVGALREVPVVVDGAVVAGTRMALTLVSDHRILYGADSARLLARIRELLESPLSVAL